MLSKLCQTFALLLSAAILLPAQVPPNWTQPFPPHKIIGNLYYVGSDGLASFLITTPKGHILINSSLVASVPLIEKSVRQLGFKFEDIKILLISHAHYDHCAGSSLIKQKTHAAYMVMDADVPEIQNGGRTNYLYANRPDFFYPPTQVDRTLHDLSTVQLGGVTLTAHLTPGHTKGCTTWTLQISDNSKIYNVVIVGSPNVNPGTRLVHNALYPTIAEDYRKGFKTLASLPCDIFLGAHGEYYNLAAKYAKQTEGASPNAFIDPTGFQAFIAERKQAFETELEKQGANTKPQE